MELVIQNISNKVSVVEMKNKPSLAVALENTKIRDYPEEIRNANTMNLVDWLLNLLGVNAKNDNVKHHAAAFEFVNKTLLNYTYQEIKLAFEKYVAGEYYEAENKPMMVTQQLNAVVIGKVMKNYEALKKSELDAYRREREKQNRKDKELTKEEKDEIVLVGILNCFEIFKETGEIQDGYTYLYQHFYELGKFPKHTNEFRENARSRAIESLEQSIKKQREEFKRVSYDYSEANITRKCKQIILGDWFKSLIEKGIEIKDEL